MIVQKIEKDLRSVSTKERAKVCASFFKTGKGEYAEGDIFLGVTVPDTRNIVKKYQEEISIQDLISLLKSDYHEMRLASCVAFSLFMKKAHKSNDEEKKKVLFETYIKNSNRINNWDLVDVSCPNVVGLYLFDKKRDILFDMVTSKNMWERRISIVSTLFFIKNKEYHDTFKICEILMHDKHDLIHKACGWMLREVGKNCDIYTLNIFLEKHIEHMPRTMLRYAIERHEKIERVKILQGIFKK